MVSRFSFRALVASAALAGAIGLSSSALAAMSAPRLSFPCGVPSSRAAVTCRLAGWGFVRRERVSITYTVSVGQPNGRYLTSAYHRTTLTDGRGAFTRPAFWFYVHPRVLAYRVTVTVAGARGDRAEIMAAGTP